MLVDDAARAQGQRIVAAADDDLARTSDIDRIITIAGVYGTATINGDINVTATRNADGGAHWFSPLNPNP